MRSISIAIAEQVREIVTQQLANLRSEEAELRAVFNGPPIELLQEVFHLVIEGGGISANLGNDRTVTVPVLLLMRDLPQGVRNPPIGASGCCDHNHLLNLRNSPYCPRFLVLLPPGYQTNLSQTSTRFDCGLSAQNSSGNEPIDKWWQDPFIENLVGKALQRFEWRDEEDLDLARHLVRDAVFAADEVERYGTDRRAAWFVLSRVWSINQARSDFSNAIGLACGFPALEDGSLNPTSQVSVLKALAERLEDGFRPCVEQLKLRASVEESAALDELLSQLQARCPVSTAVARAMPHYYGPFTGDAILPEPGWWVHLSLEKWQYLLDEDQRSAEAVDIECINPITTQKVGIVPVVSDSVKLKITLPSSSSPDSQVLISRDGAGVNSKKSWTLNVNGTSELIDSDIPEHKTPIRYVATSTGLSKGSTRVISMSHWEPGVLVCARTARKTSPPKAPRSAADKVSLEATLVLQGQGRHYLDILLRQGFALGETAIGRDNGTGVQTDELTSKVARISDTEYGVEVEAGIDSSYDISVFRPSSAVASKLRLALACDDVQAEQCNSEFERLILLNRQRKDRQGSSSVHVNRQHRSADLQSWMLSKEHFLNSHYPLVFGPDYADDWRVRNWTSQADTILSKGRFLSDPRPSVGEMVPPPSFLRCRQSIVEKVRGDDNKLIEGARLGEWLIDDPTFEEDLDSYVRSYLEWLDSSPEIASWCDLAIVTGMEGDQKTLALEPDAILISPLHPVRLAWQALAQRTLFLAHRKMPCPAASILNPHTVPDILTLPMRTATGGFRDQIFFSVESNSDYWSVLWNSTRLERIGDASIKTPFEKEFGVLIGGLSSSFSVSQVRRCLDDIATLLTAKPLLNVSVTSSSSQNSATNDGLIAWCRSRYGAQIDERPTLRSMGRRFIRILDRRSDDHRPDEAEISNLAEDTQNSVSWYRGPMTSGPMPDLTIVAQLETSNMSTEPSTLASPMGPGGLIRARIRQQLKAGAGAFLLESRMGIAPTPSGDGLLDKTAAAISRLENLATAHCGYVFAPSVHVLQSALSSSRYVAVSSSAVDPACFLGGWLDDTYLWDYDLPSYSSRAGDSNGYYLLAKITEVDRETLRNVVQRLPNCTDLSAQTIDNLILEVARRGIPTVRGLSSGNSGAIGDLGLFVAARLLQDEFRVTENKPSLFPVWTEEDGVAHINLLIPIDPFRCYLDDLTHAIAKTSKQRPDLLLVSLRIDDATVECRLTPVEVKYRGTTDPMSNNECQAALAQAQSFSSLLNQMDALSKDPEMLMWRLTYRHLYLALLEYGFRVYSQQVAVTNRTEKWADYQARVMSAIVSDELRAEVDTRGRLIVIDGSPSSAPRDVDNDGFFETISITREDAAEIVTGDGQPIYIAVRERLGTWATTPGRSRKGIPQPVLDGGNNEGAPSTQNGDLPPNISVPSETSVDPAIPTTAVAPSIPPTLVAEQVATDGVNILLGESIDAFKAQTRILSLSDTNLNQMNIGVVGDLGTGKTQLLKSIIYQITTQTAQNKGIQPNILIIDYKKDYSSEEFVSATNARVVKPHMLKLNLFDTSQQSESMTPWLDRFRFFADVLDKIYSGIGPVQRSHLKAAVRAAYDSKQGTNTSPTIYDVHRCYQGLIANKQDSISAIIEDLVDMELFAPDTTAASTKDFLSGVVVISLNALGQDDKSKNMLVAVLLNLFYENMLKIPKRPFYGESPQKRVLDSFLLVDEADNIMKYEFDVLRKILLQGREFGVGVILASQYLRHFKVGATDYREPLLTWLIHKVPNVSPQELGALGLTTTLPQVAERVKSLGLHECLFKTFNIGGEFIRGVPFYSLLER
jgi:hypothetical protein